MLQKTNAAIVTYASRIANLEEQKAEITEDIKEAYADAKNEGFTVSALKKAIKIHSMDADKRAKHESEQTDLILYLEQIEGRIEG